MMRARRVSGGEHNFCCCARAKATISNEPMRFMFDSPKNPAPSQWATLSCCTRSSKSISLGQCTPKPNRAQESKGASPPLRRESKQCSWLMLMWQFSDARLLWHLACCARVCCIYSEYLTSWFTCICLSAGISQRSGRAWCQCGVVISWVKSDFTSE